MNAVLSNKYLNLIIRLVIGFIFIFAGLGKAADPVLFSKEIANYNILPLWSVNTIALTMPWIELTTGIFLILGVRIKASSFISGIMLVVFIAAVYSAMARGLNINCGCFSGKQVIVGWPKILENLATLIGCCLIFFFPVQKFSVENLNRDE